MPHPDEGTIHAWLDGELSLEEGAALEEHLGTCDECVAHVAEARGLIAGSARITGMLDDVPSGVIPATAGGASGMTPLGEMLTASTGEGPSVQPVTEPDIAPVGPAKRPWWMSNQIRAAAAVVIVVGGVLVSWGRLNKGEVALKDSADATPPFLAVHADTLSAPREGASTVREAAPTAAAADARAANPTAQTAASGAVTASAPVAGAAGSRETKVAVTTPAKAAFDSAARNRAQAERRGLVGDVSGVMAGVVTGSGSADTAASRRLLAQRTAALAEEQRRERALAASRVPPPAESKTKVAVEAEQRRERDAAASAADVSRAAVGAAAPTPRVSAPSAPVPSGVTTGDVLRHPYAGCYTIQSARWNPALSAGELAAIPASFELDTLTSTGGASTGRGLVHPRPESVRLQYQAMYWQPDAPGRATVTMRGAQRSLTLALAGGGTQGFALFSRSGAATSNSPITLSRAACR